MNAIAKTAPTSLITVNRLVSFSISRQNLLLGLLIACIVASAFAIVYVRGFERQLTSELQLLQQNYQDLKMKNGQLLLEQTAWSTQGRVEAIAQGHLNMVIPEQNSIEMVRL